VRDQGSHEDLACASARSGLADSVGQEVDPAGAVAGLSLGRIAQAPQSSIAAAFAVVGGQRCRFACAKSLMLTGTDLKI
jgi:hypothetical protein